MADAIQDYWALQLERAKKALEANHFGVYIADTRKMAKKMARDVIIPQISPRTISWGGSMTFVNSGLYDELKSDSRYTILDTYDKQISPEAGAQRRREALLADLFITGANAITQAGHVVNLDMVGNRVGALTFGPRHVLLLVGRNKLVSDQAAAMARIKKYAAPVNAMRLGKQTPCAKTGCCENCASPDRICNTWVITEKCFPQKRINIILINEAMGL
ncbi:lactate utilization protein [Desulfosarcina sp. OttesenSCG-928-G10]|nr:lactate utilization protein [Desulfosarcina sp. OttesenSCG-928-G10]